MRFMLLLMLLSVVSSSCLGDDDIKVVCKLQTIGEEEFAFHAVIVLNVVRNGRTETIRIPTEQGLRDSLELEAKDTEFLLPKDSLFGNAPHAALTCVVYSSGSIPIVYQPFLSRDSDSVRVEQWMWGRAAYRARSSTTLPTASEELRRAASFLDPATQADLIRQLNEDAEEEDAIAKRQMSLLLPAYIYPPDRGALADKRNVLAQLNGKDWQAIETDLKKLADIGIESWVIVSPPVAPGAKVNEQYAEKIKMLARIKSNAVGYVSLGRGDGTARTYESIESVESQLENWVRLYPSVKGFFFDTCPTEEKYFANVESVVKLAKKVLPRGKVFINPGTVPEDAYLRSELVDVICVETNLGSSTLVEVRDRKPKMAAILWNNGQPDSEVASVKARGYEFVYVTDRNDQIDLDGVPGMDDNGRWGRLPTQSNWRRLLNSIYRTKTSTSDTPVKKK